LLSGHAIGFDENFDYFERSGAHASFDLKAKSKAVPVAKKAAAAAAAAAGLSEASMIQAAIAAAKAAVAGVTANVAQAGAQGVPESQVAERLEAVKQWAAQKLKAKDDEEKLKMKAFELDAQSKLENEKATMQKAAVEKEANDQKIMAQKEAARKEVVAQEHASAQVEKVKLDAEKAAVQAEVAAAGQEKRDAQGKADSAKRDVADANEKTVKAKEQEKLKSDAFKKEKSNAEQEVALVQEKDTKAANGEVKTAVASNVARARSEMAEKTKLSNEENVERTQKTDVAEKARKTVAAQELAAKKKETNSLKDKVRAETADLQAANQKVAEATAAKKQVEGEAEVNIEKAKEVSSAKMAANEVEAKATANQEISKANLQKERSSELLRKKERTESDAQKATVEAAEKSNAKNDACGSELAKMRVEARAEETQVAKTASEIEDEKQATKMLDDAKAKWKKQLDDKIAACTTKEISYTTNVKSTESASVATAAGPAMEEVSLLETEENTLSLNPWPLDVPVEATNVDGSKAPPAPFKNAEQRLMESNAATTRGYSPIEGGAQEQTAYFKFPVAKLKTGETIKSAVIKFEKKGGPQADCLVKTTPCDYDSKSLTYKNKPNGIDLISQSGVFPAADGPVSINMDASAITNYLNKEKTAQLCVVISGGLAKQQDLMDEVQVSMQIHRKAKSPSFAPENKEPVVTVARRRRSQVSNARRRRSVQEIKDEAVKIKAAEEKEYSARYGEESKTKMPATIEAKKLAIEAEMRKAQLNLVKQEVESKLSAAFSKDKVKAEMDAMRIKKVASGLKKMLPVKFAEDSTTLKNRMRSKLTADMTKAEEKLIELEAKTMADNTVQKDSAALLAGAIKKKAAADYPGAMKAEVEKRAPKDFTAAVDVMVVKSVAEKTKQAVDKAVQAEISTQLKLQEQGVASKAATEAVNKRLDELVAQEITKYIQKQKSDNTELGKALSKKKRSNAHKTALTRVKNIVASKPSPLSASEKTSVEKLAADQAVAQLKTKITAESNDKIRTKEFVDNVVRDLKKSETTRLTPIIKADILKNLEKQLGPLVKKRTDAAAAAYVNSEKVEVLGILHAALVQKNKLALMPKMNKKLEKSVPQAIASPKFEAQVTAAQAELKEKIRAQIRKELEEPLEKVAKIQIRQQEREKREELTTKVKISADKKLAKDIEVATRGSKVEPQAQIDAANTLKDKIDKKVAEKVREHVDKTLKDRLKEAIKDKYEVGTMKDAKNQVKMNHEEKIRTEIGAKMKIKSEKAAGAKIVAAKLALRKSLAKSLTETFYQKAKKADAEKLKEATKGMSLTDKKATELAQDKEYKSKAAQAAEKQAEVELAGEKGEQLAKRIKQEELNKAMQGVDQEVAQQVAVKAKVLSDTALANLMKDDLQAMEKGEAHVAAKASQGKEDSSEGPNVSKTDMAMAQKDPVVMQMTAAAGAVPKETKVEEPKKAAPAKKEETKKAAPAKKEETKKAAPKEEQKPAAPAKTEKEGKEGKEAEAKEAKGEKPAAKKDEAKEANGEKPAAKKDEAKEAKEAKGEKPAAKKDEAKPESDVEVLLE